MFNDIGKNKLVSLFYLSEGTSKRTFSKYFRKIRHRFQHIISFCLVLWASCQGAKAQFVDVDSIQSVQIKCMGGKYGQLFVIRSQSELEEHAKLGWSNHPLCSSYELPIIDFSRHILILYSEGLGGCDKPKVKVELLKNVNENKMKFKIVINEIGNCLMLHPVNVQYLIPSTHMIFEKEISVYSEDGTLISE